MRVCLGPFIPGLVALWRIGLPTGVQFALEVGAFAMFSAMIARYSDVEMAGHQITLQVIHCSFLPGYALADAVSVLTGQAVGAQRLGMVRRLEGGVGTYSGGAAQGVGRADAALVDGRTGWR